MLGIRQRLMGRIRRFNRWWIDRLAPAEPPGPSTAPVERVVTRPAPAQQPVSITSEETPNPDARKFVANVRIVPSGSLSFSNRRAAADHPLGRELFEIDGVKSIFATGDFLTVTRDAGADWDRLTPAVEQQLTRILGERAA
ncbi:MAG: NifU N-terminal domain-containing protein [Deltaproteobacteria bacterium]|nr:NifU N-terminal domain-containing protein [Deltaproteobacteria bacterium]